MTNIDEIKKQRLETLVYFETLGEAISFAAKSTATSNKVFGFFKIAKEGKEIFTISYPRDWELLLRNGFSKIEGIRY